MDGGYATDGTSTFADAAEGTEEDGACRAPDVRAALADVWAETLDRLGMGCALVDRHGRILQATASYHATLAGLTAEAETARPVPSIEAATRRILVESACVAPGAARNETLLVLDGRPVGAFIRPTALDRLRPCLGDPVGVVVLRGTDAEPARLETMIRAFGLTRREAQAALGVMRGEAPAAIARRLAVSIHTVRTHLAQAYAKTGTAGRAEMAVKLNASPVAWTTAATFHGYADLSAARRT